MTGWQLCWSVSFSLLHKVIGCDHGFEGSSMEQSGTPRGKEHKMTQLHQEPSPWRIQPGEWVQITRAQSTYMFTTSFPTDSKSLQSLLELPTESISSQENPFPPQNHPGDGGLLFLTGFQVSQTMTLCTRAPWCQKILMYYSPFVSVKSFPGEERDSHYIPTTPPETFLTLP